MRIEPPTTPGHEIGSRRCWLVVFPLSCLVMVLARRIKNVLSEYSTPHPCPSPDDFMRRLRSVNPVFSVLKTEEMLLELPSKRLLLNYIETSLKEKAPASGRRRPNPTCLAVILGTAPPLLATEASSTHSIVSGVSGITDT